MLFLVTLWQYTCCILFLLGKRDAAGKTWPQSSSVFMHRPCYGFASTLSSLLSFMPLLFFLPFLSQSPLGTDLWETLHRFKDTTQFFPPHTFTCQWVTQYFPSCCIQRFVPTLATALRKLCRKSPPMFSNGAFSHACLEEMCAWGYPTMLLRNQIVDKHLS